MKPLRIATRTSKLAMKQTETVQRLLHSAHPDITTEIVPVMTKGDRILDVALSKIGDKGLFTQALEARLLSGEVDLCVHSLKDLPTTLSKGLALGGVLERGDARDVLISANYTSLSDIPAGGIIGTSSLRRTSQVHHLAPHLTVTDIRGNVETRIKKMRDGQYDALILAAAGVIRLGATDQIAHYFDLDTLLPAPAQGVIGIEIRENDTAVLACLEPITHPDSWVCATAERMFLHTLEGGCQIPMACHAGLTNQQMLIQGFIGSIDGKQQIRDQIMTPVDQSLEAARTLATRMHAAGGSHILNSIRNNHSPQNP